MNLRRLIIEGIEGRILMGITMFVAIIILIGWVAINEEARMQSFVQQFDARAIERGGELYASSCTTCHGNDGLGIAERAPALNNPHLFGVDIFGGINEDIARIQTEVATLTGTRVSLQNELTDSENPPSTERQVEILERIQEIDGELDARNEELAPLLEERLTILDSIQPVLDAGFLPGYAPGMDEVELTELIADNGTRLGMTSWGGDLNSYIVTTLIHGRPGSAVVWPASNGGMVSWSQRGSGNLRDDQIQDIALYIQNWDKGENWTLEDWLAVSQFGKPIADGTLIGPPSEVDVAGSDVDDILARIEAGSIVGDPVRGEALYTGGERTETRARLGCSGCHGAGSAPETDGTWTRTQNERLTLPQFAGYTGEQYLIESIVLPDAYISPGYSSGIMAGNFGEQLSVQDVADIVAYLVTQE